MNPDEGGKLIIWIGAKGNATDIRFNLLVDSLKPVAPATAEVIIGTDPNEDGQLDTVYLPWSSADYPVAAQQIPMGEDPLVLYEDVFGDLSLTDGQIAEYESAFGVAPAGAEVIVDSAGCHRFSQEISKAFGSIPSQPVLCKVLVRPAQ